MARIVIMEPSFEVRELFALVVMRLGHEAVCYDNFRDESLEDADAVLLDLDVLLVEPGSPSALAIAQQLRERLPALPIICASIYPRSPEVAALDPVAYLLKPFALAELEGALENAVARTGPPALA